MMALQDFLDELEQLCIKHCIEEMAVDNDIVISDTWFDVEGVYFHDRELYYDAIHRKAPSVGRYSEFRPGAALLKAVCIKVNGGTETYISTDLPLQRILTAMNVGNARYVYDGTGQRITDSSMKPIAGQVIQVLTTR